MTVTVQWLGRIAMHVVMCHGTHTSPSKCATCDRLALQCTGKVPATLTTQGKYRQSLQLTSRSLLATMAEPPGPGGLMQSMLFVHAGWDVILSRGGPLSCLMCFAYREQLPFNV